MKNRTLLELLIIVRDKLSKPHIKLEEKHCNRHYYTNKYGLCRFVYLLESRRFINKHEHEKLQDYILMNYPPHSRLYKKVEGYWFKPGSKPPRLRWLDKRIEIEKTKI